MIVDCCMYIYILVQFVDTTDVAFLSCTYVYTILYHLIALFASFLPLLLLLLIVIYVDVGIYDETIIMDWVLVC